MKHIKLNSPIPRNRNIQYCDFRYDIINRIYLPTPNSKPIANFFDVVESRISRREFEKLPTDILSLILWYSAKTKLVTKLDNGNLWQHRPSPSAGGRHPIDILIIDSQVQEVYLYDTLAHTLCQLNSSKEILIELVEVINTIVPINKATIIWFAAQFGRTLSKYEYGESLVWRDAGALLATIAFVAEALQLSCCPIGITGEPLVSKILSSNNFVVGVGGCLVGNMPIVDAEKV